jgi:hypothetical protein
MLEGHIMTKQLLAACLCLVLTACRVAAAPPDASPPDVVAHVRHCLQMEHSFPDTSRHHELRLNNSVDVACRLIGSFSPQKFDSLVCRHWAHCPLAAAQDGPAV